MHEVQDSGMGLCVADLECNPSYVWVIVVTAHACWNDMHVVYYSHKLKNTGRKQ